MSQSLQILEGAALVRAVEALDGWEVREGKLSKTFSFPGFVEAFGFMTQVALVAERKDHHPEWRNVYGRVEVALVTHVAGGVTERDLRLAGEMERLASTFARRGAAVG